MEKIKATAEQINEVIKLHTEITLSMTAIEILGGFDNKSGAKKAKDCLASLKGRKLQEFRNLFELLEK